MIVVWTHIRANTSSFWLEEGRWKWIWRSEVRIKCKHLTRCKNKYRGSYKRRVSKAIVTVPSPSVLFSKSCLACSLEMRLLPSRNSRNFCGELRVITQRPWVPATAPALKIAIYDKAAKGKGLSESLFKAFIRACPSSDWNRIAARLTKWKYFGRVTPLPADQRVQSGSANKFRVLNPIEFID